MRLVFAFIALLPLASAADPWPDMLLFVGDLQWVKRFPDGYRQLAPPGTAEEKLDSVAVSFGCGDEEAHFSVVTPLVGPRLTEASIISSINEFCEPTFYIGMKRAVVLGIKRRGVWRAGFVERLEQIDGRDVLLTVLEDDDLPFPLSALAKDVASARIEYDPRKSWGPGSKDWLVEQGWLFKCEDRYCFKRAIFLSDLVAYMRSNQPLHPDASRASALSAGERRR